MGGAGFVFVGINDADIIHNSLQINLNVAEIAVSFGIKKLFFSSSACIYPMHNQHDPDNPQCEEDSVYPANPDSDYGWEKLMSERLYLAYARNKNLNIRIARFHNIMGPLGTFSGGKEKAPAAICRKVILTNEGETIEIWGDGHQTRSFLYIDECLDGVRRLMDSNYTQPINIGSEEMISINNLAKMIIKISGKNIDIKNIPTTVLGVKGRNSDNTLIKQVLNWEPNYSLQTGIESVYHWIEGEIRKTAHRLCDPIRGEKDV